MGAIRSTIILCIMLLLGPLTHAYSQTISPEISEVFRKNSQSFGGAVGVAVWENATAPVYVKVHVAPGSGRITYNVKAYDLLFPTSIKIAVYEAAWFLGLNPWRYDYNVSLETPIGLRSFRGPSLGLTVFLATIAAFKNLSLRGDVMATGVLNPDLTVGFVGNVDKKAKCAAEYNMSIFIYPLLQSREWRVGYEAVHVGPYIIPEKVIRASPLDFNVSGVKLVEVGNGLEALSIISGVNESLPLNLETEISRFMEDVDSRILMIGEALDHLEREFVDEVKLLNYTVKWKIDDNNKRLRTEYSRMLEEALGYLRLYRTLNSKGLILASMDALLNAFMRVKYCKYLYVIALTGERELPGREVVTELKAAEKMLEGSSVAGAESILTLGYCSYLLREANKLSDRATLSLKFANLAKNRYETLRGIARDYAEAYILSKKAQLLASTLITGSHTGNINESMLWSLSFNTLNYVADVIKFSRRYIMLSGVESDIPLMAGDLTWMGLQELDKNNTLASLAYASEALGYIQTLLALHPGFEQIEEVRYDYVLRNFYLETEGLKEVPMISRMYLEIATLQDNIDSKVLGLEKALAYVKVYRLIKTVIPTPTTTGSSKISYSVYKTIESVNNEEIGGQGIIPLPTPLVVAAVLTLIFSTLLVALYITRGVKANVT